MNSKLKHEIQMDRLFDLSQKKPILPSAKEVAKNARARSAKLRLQLEIIWCLAEILGEEFLLEK